MKRPELHQVPLPASASELAQPGSLWMTVSPGQWDKMHQEAYERGFTILEIKERNGKKKIVRAFKKET